jgi:hypothetical protein
MAGQTTASPAIWANRADFEAKAAAYAAAADKLGELTGDTEAFKAQLAVVNETCRSCHTVYRVRPGASGRGEGRRPGPAGGEGAGDHHPVQHRQHQSVRAQDSRMSDR